MKNATKMARYMMMRTGHENGEMRMNYGGDYERGREVRNGYGGYGNEGGNYARDNYGMDNRFRDRRGREHYDNGRFAPRNELGNMGGDYSGGYSRSNSTGREYRTENRPRYEEEMMEEDGWEMNQIGFDRPYEVKNHYPFIIENQSEGEMMRHGGAKMHGGSAQMTDRGMDKEMAEEWVNRMKNADGTEGEHWRLDQIKALMSQKALDRNPFEIYAVMNAMYSDYGKVLKKRGITTPDAYLDMALAFINDPDAVPNKAAAYYEYIVKH